MIGRWRGEYNTVGPHSSLRYFPPAPEVIQPSLTTLVEEKMTKTTTVQAQQRWEYMSISRKTDTYLAQELNTLGQDCWDLITVSFAKGQTGEMFWTAFLKRPAVGHASPGTAAQEATRAHHDPAPASSSPTAPTPTPAPEGFDQDEDMFAIHEEPDKEQ